MTTLVLEHLQHADSASPDITIDSNGRVGIGTTSPDCALDVTRTSGWAEMHLDGAAGGDLILKDNGVSYGEIYAGNGHGMVLKSYTNQHMHFLTDANATAKMTILANGNVGIGTDSPNTALEIAGGQIWVRQDSGSSTGRGLQFGYAGNHGSYRSAIKGGPESYGVTDSGILTFHTQNGYVVSDTPPERMRIDSSGRVKIGTNETTIGDQQLFISGTKTSFATLGYSLWQNQLAVHDNRIPSGGAGTEAGVGGSISFTAESGGGQKTWLGLVEGYKQNSTAGDYGGGLKMRVRQNGNPTMLTGISIDSNARVTTPQQPSFNAQRTSNQGIQGGTTLIFNQARHNTGNHYNTSTGVFTAPVTGDYLFTFKALFYAFASSEYLDLYSTVNGTTRNRYEQTGNNGQHTQIDYTEVVRLNANDGFYLYANNRNSGATLYSMYGNENHFSGYLLG